MKKISIITFMVALLAILSLGLTSHDVFADGTEELGDPNIEIAPGSGFVAAGTGLITPPGEIPQGEININVPGDVQQALLYWQCQPGTGTVDNPIPVSGDDTISVNLTDVTGAMIGDMTQTNVKGLYTVTYRADITGMVSSGDNTLTINDLDCSPSFAPIIHNNGAGVLVIYDDGTLADVQVRDGSDYAFCNNSFRDPDDPTLKETVPQTFFFAPSDFARSADLSLFVSSVEGIISGPVRPSTVIVTVDTEVTAFYDMLNSNDGDEWDTFTRTINIPATADALTVEVISPPEYFDTDPKCASLNWNVAGLTIDIEEGGEGCTPGYWKQSQHFDSWTGYTPITLFSEVFDDAFPGKTLLQVLNKEVDSPNDLRQLGFHTVAALLSAAAADVNYDRTADQVIMMFNNVYPGGNYSSVKNIFEGFNEQGCPLGRAEVEGEDKDKKEKKK